MRKLINQIRPNVVMIKIHEGTPQTAIDWAVRVQAKANIKRSFVNCMFGATQLLVCMKGLATINTNEFYLALFAYIMCIVTRKLWLMVLPCVIITKEA